MALCRLRASFVSLREPFSDVCGEFLMVLYQPKRSFFGTRGAPSAWEGFVFD